jgi:hypothetical protein
MVRSPAGGDRVDLEVRLRRPSQDLPERYGLWQTVHERLSRWRCKGLFDGLPGRLRFELNTEGLVDRDLWCIGGVSVRASRARP